MDKTGKTKKETEMTGEQDIKFVMNVMPAVVTGNFEQIKSYLEVQLKEYDVTVTEENLPGCKKMSAELSALKNNIEDRRKSIKELILEPYKSIEDQVKELVGMVDSAQKLIKEQVKVFEDVKLESCRTLLENELYVQYDALGVEEEYRKASIDNLVKLSSMTPKGGLAKSAMESVASLATKDKGLQELHLRRMVTAENLCLKAGIQPIAKIHLSAILGTQDERLFEYQLQSLVDAEVEHQANVVSKSINTTVAGIETKTEQSEKTGDNPTTVATTTATTAPTDTRSKTKYIVTISFPISTDNLEGIEERIINKFGLPNIASVNVRLFDAGDMEQ